MKSLLLAMLVGLMMVGCGEEAQKEAVQEEAKDESAAPLGEKFTVPDLNLTMIWVKPGTFMMGDKGKQHQVTLSKGFYLGKHEVTQAQWKRVIGGDPSKYKGADRPVERVTWTDAVEFCKKLTEMERKAGRVPEGMAYQLPTEAQWEYVCRAGTTTVYSWGDSISSKNANYKRGYSEGTTPVGNYPANPWGFHDMHGNVWEWCADWSGTYPSGSVTNPEGPASGSSRVRRGGSWHSVGAHLCSAGRSHSLPPKRSYTLGFRVGCGEEARKEAVQEEAPFAIKPGEKLTIPDLGPEMLWVEPGTFMMGYKGEQHQVTLTKGFYLGKYEVTQAQWERVMGSDPSYFKGANRPVEHVSWNDAVEFCKKLTEMEKKAGRVPEGMAYQLPTESQWEYACRAGTTTVYSWGDSIGSSNANYVRKIDETTPVGKYPANPWGFHDMHGNVWEWCADWYAEYPSGAVTNPEGPASGSARVLRGGSWYSGGTGLRSAKRTVYPPRYRLNSLGFRVAFQKQ